MYIYQRDKWPHFTWNTKQINQALVDTRFDQGRLLGKMEGLGFELQTQALLATLTSDIIKTSEIEGEHLNEDEVRSSIARHLGVDIGGLLPSDRHVDGLVEMILDATQHHDQPLTSKRLSGWHELMFPTGMSGLMLVNPGVMRNDAEGPMQVISGSYGREKIHFQAPPAQDLAREMKQFLTWFNQSHPKLDDIIKAGIAHLWFVTIHPFDDGNGRLSRAIADMVLARSEKQKNRFYSMSTQIRRQRKAYYDILERTQKSTLDITPWLLWFISCLHQAILEADSFLGNVLNKATFWEQHAKTQLNTRQIKMLNHLFDGIRGKLSSSKWAKMTKCSQDTATRDINQLITLGILVKSDERGRSTSYWLNGYQINQID